jgi:hypothetical protein
VISFALGASGIESVFKSSELYLLFFWCDMTSTYGFRGWTVFQINYPISSWAMDTTEN